MYWVIKMYKDYNSYLDPVIINRNPPFYTVQGRKKKGGRSNRRG